jgi:hypothetical protein
MRETATTLPATTPAHSRSAPSAENAAHALPPARLHQPLLHVLPEPGHLTSDCLPHSFLSPISVDLWYITSYAVAQAHRVRVASHGAVCARAGAGALYVSGFHGQGLLRVSLRDKQPHVSRRLGRWFAAGTGSGSTGSMLPTQGSHTGVKRVFRTDRSSGADCVTACGVFKCNVTGGAHALRRPRAGTPIFDTSVIPPPHSSDLTSYPCR